MSEEIETVDLLAALQRSLTRAKDARRAGSSSATATESGSEGQDTRDTGRKPPRLSQERRLEVGAERRAKTAARNADLAAKTAPTGYRIGQWVHTHTRSRAFDNRIGVVVTNNLGEVGVGFGTEWSIQLPPVDAWFLPTELTKLRAQGGH